MEPRFSITPQPIIAEILSGLATIVLLGAGYCVKNRDFANWLRQLSAGEMVGLAAAVFALSWLLGTFLDTCRDIFEWIVDKRRELNWQFLITAAAEDVERLNDWYIAYYLLNANCVVGTLVVLGFKWSGLIGLPAWAYAVVIIFGAVNLLGASLTRIELREIMGIGLPHERVFTRLRPSLVHRGGVGVFAIRNISKGTYIFEPDDIPVVSIDAARLDRLPKDLRQLYYDFGTLNKGKYTVPVSFNKLTVAWYLNEPGRGNGIARDETTVGNNGAMAPNVKCDKDLRFYACADIKAGDELTVNYDEYCERPPE